MGYPPPELGCPTCIEAAEKLAESTESFCRSEAFAFVHGFPYLQRWLFQWPPCVCIHFSLKAGLSIAWPSFGAAFCLLPSPYLSFVFSARSHVISESSKAVKAMEASSNQGDWFNTVESQGSRIFKRQPFFRAAWQTLRAEARFPAQSSRGAPIRTRGRL